MPFISSCPVRWGEVVDRAIPLKQLEEVARDLR